MNTMEKIEKFVGPIAHPMWDGTCLTRHEGDIVLLEHSGEVALRIKPDGLGEATIPSRMNKRWLEVVGSKFGIKGIYERRNIKHAQHREVKMHHCSFLMQKETPLSLIADKPGFRQSLAAEMCHGSKRQKHQRLSPVLPTDCY